jgi:hypothetical protein
MKKTYLYLIFICLFVLSNNTSFSQEIPIETNKKNFAVGVHFNINGYYNDYKIKCNTIVNGEEICILPKGDSLSTSTEYGGKFEVLKFKPFIFGISIGYLSAKFESKKVIFGSTILKTENDSIIQVWVNDFSTQYKGNYKGYYLSTYFGYNFFDSFNSKIGLEFAMNSKIYNKSIYQKLSPGYFVPGPWGDSSRTVEIESLPLNSDTQIFVSALLGLSYDISLFGDGAFLLSPEISFRIGLNELEKSWQWKQNSLSAGLVLKYTF